MNAVKLLEWAKQFEEKSISGRYVTHQHIENYLEKNNIAYCVSAYSVDKRPIYTIKIGEGTRKVLIWSQMHGNESTTTKGLVDFLNYLHSDEAVAQQLLQTFQFVILPILNPDGAFYYTRVNANQVDLNRDAFRQTQPEMRYLQQVIAQFEPDFCFNLHDQRTIFSAGNVSKPATLSLLSPAYNQAREIDDVRKKVMRTAVAIADVLDEIIPGQLGRYDDAFNMNCIGDYLTANKVPTLLIEAGHFPDDYAREQTRNLVFVALVSALLEMKNQTEMTENIVKKYEQIPENQKLFNDVLVKNVIVENKELSQIGFQYQEKLTNGKIEFLLQFDEDKVSEGKFGHVELDLEYRKFTNKNELIKAVSNQISGVKL